jgi:gas vesicle protein
MLKKNKILIGIAIGAVIAVTLGLVLGGLDQLSP